VTEQRFCSATPPSAGGWIPKGVVLTLKHLRHSAFVRQSIFVIGLAAAGGSAGILIPTVVSAAPVVAPAGSKPSTSAATLAAAAGVALTDLNLASASGDEADLVRYVAERDALAAAVATELGIAPVRMQTAWTNSDTSHQAALLAALTQLGVPYRRNTSVEGQGFDCSGLTTFAWKASGLNLYRQSATQIKQAQRVSADQAQAGDLVYYPGHVSMYLGVDRAIVHAVGTGRFVEIGHIRNGKSVKFGDPVG
jgi:cell wall-associated NlpC family hydrolase